MRIRKEDRIIQNGSKISEELNRIYLEGICIDEYEKLLDEYKRLYKRYEKTIKFSDNIENSIINKNESLSDNLDYTIKTARNKLFQNISEHKKTKITLSSYKQELDQYKNVLDELILEKAIIQKKLNGYIKHFGEIKHQFAQSVDDEIKLDNSKNKKLQNISLEKVLSLAFIDNEKDFILIKLELQDFEKIIGEADTLAGLILEIKGEIPQNGEVLTYNRYVFEIISADKRRIKTIKLTIKKEDAQDE